MTAAVGITTPRLERAQALARERIEEAATLLNTFGVPRFELGGSVLRPLVAYALGGSAAESSAAPRFWSGALAVQLAHEASLLHDDVIDGAATRRGAPTVAASRGAAAALLIGDHALTSAYRAAAMSADVGFMAMFARAVERTVAGEREQASSIGTTMDLPRYREIVLAKSGELFGCAAATGAVLSGRRDASEWFELGRRVGLVYQMLDDLLDYCPGTDTGKPALGDHAQGRWTWPLSVVDADPFDAQRASSEIVEMLFAPAAGASASPARRALATLEGEIDGLASALRAVSSDQLVIELLEEWRATATAAVETEEARLRPPAAAAPVLVLADGAAPRLAEASAYMSRHSRSFRFATLLLPAEERAAVERVYAWCRYTDDLVDRLDARDTRSLARAEARLDAWLDLSREAYLGAPSRVDLLDAVMRDMKRQHVPFAYAELIVDGVRMDLRPREYATMTELREYTWRVASAVGLWLCGLYGIDDRAMLDRASSLGHAMQLTNILRDVGEDLENGRLYLPLDLLRRHGLVRADLVAMRSRARPIDASYKAMIEEMIGIAEASYRAADDAIPHLPAAFGRSVAVASAVYSDIHRRIRANGYDNLRRRAHTTPLGKVVTGARALLNMQGSSGASTRQPLTTDVRAQA